MDARKNVDLIGFPMDLGADRRGVDMGPSAMRIAGIEDRLVSLGYTVINHDDIFIRNREIQKVEDKNLKYLSGILRRSATLANRVEKSLDQGHFPLCLGGDHSMALGTIAGVAAHCRQRDLRVGVIWIDAHADMNTHQTTPSGNIHGMPMAASLGFGHPQLVEFFGLAPKVKAEDCFQIGVRSVDPKEKEIIRESGLKVYTISDVDRHGLHQIIHSVIAQLKSNVDHVHVSFDLDSVDPLEAPGVGTPVPGGLGFREAHLLMEAIAESGIMGSLEVAEVNPILDDKNRSAELAVDLVASCMGQRIL